MIDASRKAPLAREEYDKIANALDQWFTSQSIDERDVMVAMVHLQSRLLVKHKSTDEIITSIENMARLLLAMSVNHKINQALS